MRNAHKKTISSGLLAVASVVFASGCGSSQGVYFWNGGPGEVSVTSGDENFTLAGNSGVELVESKCTADTVQIVFASGASTELKGPICSDESVLLQDDKALVSTTTNK